MVPAFLVIDNSLPFRASDVRSGRTNEPLDEAELTFSLIDYETRAEITSGDMTPYDDGDNASFEAVIAASELPRYDAEDAPNGLVPNREYALRVTVDNAGVLTTKSFVMVALLDPPPQE